MRGRTGCCGRFVFGHPGWARRWRGACSGDRGPGVEGAGANEARSGAERKPKGAHRSRGEALSATTSSRPPTSGGRSLVVLLVALAMAMAVTGPGSAEARGASARASATGRLQIYYRSPVLVRTGERVRIPVDVACATATGRPCRATVALGTAGPSGRWQELATRAGPEGRFDIPAPAIRAARTRGQGAGSYSLSARGAR